MNGKIHEIYHSISGEGISAGIPTIFVRFAGCSLRCGLSQGRKLWCDTPQALGPNQGESWDLSKIWKEIVTLDLQHSRQILLTGGEPLEGKNAEVSTALSDEIFRFRTENHFPFPLVRIETNGKEDIRQIEHAVYSLDYKLPGSGMESQMAPENFHFLRKRHNSLDELKFVVRDGIDFQRSLEILREFSPDTHVSYSAVAEELPPQELAEWIKKHNPPKARLSLQMHKVLWGNQKGV